MFAAPDTGRIHKWYDKPMNITDPIRRVARLHPSAIAVVGVDNIGIPYRDLDRAIDAVVERVGGMGVVAGQTAGLGVTGPDEYPALVLALALARAGVITAELSYPAERMDFCFLPAGAPEKPGTRCIAFDASWTRISPADPAPDVRTSPGGASVCRIFSSSGTTGTPKFAAISHETMVNRVLSNTLSMGPPEQAYICAVSLGITWGFATALRILWAGSTLVLTNPAQALAAIRRHRVNAMVIAPISLQAIIATVPPGQGRPGSLKAIEVGGSVLPPRLHDLARQKLCDNIVSYFGSMETGGVASASVATLPRDGKAVGYVHAGVEVQAVDADDNPLPASVEGRLRIRGANTIAGYFGDSDVTSSPFRDGWFYSGDVGSVSRDGIMSITGRVSEFINSGGVKISPHVIEDVLLTLPEVTDAAAFGVPDDMGVDQIWAAIVATTPIDAGRLNALCQQRLAASAPKFILQIKGLPRNPNGKVRREELVRFAVSQTRRTV